VEQKIKEKSFLLLKNNINAKFILLFFCFFILVQFIYHLYNKNVIGYGGDQIGLIDFFNAQNEVQLKNLGLYDFVIKKIAILFESGFYSQSFLTFSAIAINLLFSLSLRPLLIRLFQLNINNSYFATLLIALEPLTISLILSGHIAFFPALPFYLTLKFFNHSSFLNLIVLGIIFLINPYLCIGYIILSLLVDMTLKNKNRIIFYFIISLLLIVKHILEKYIFEYHLFDLSNRLIPSGIYPVNFFLPDINSFVGALFTVQKNYLFTYLNVPESNYSLLILIVLLIFTFNFKSINNIIKIISIFILLSLIFCFPPYTSKYGGIFFPSILLNELLPELRIISRNSL
jgi:hypothetical protein